VHIHIYTNAFTYLLQWNTRIYVHEHTKLYVHTCICTVVRIHTYRYGVYIYSYKCLFIPLSMTHTNICAYIHVYICSYPHIKLLCIHIFTQISVHTLLIWRTLANSCAPSSPIWLKLSPIWISDTLSFSALCMCGIYEWVMARVTYTYIYRCKCKQFKDLKSRARYWMLRWMNEPLQTWMSHCKGRVEDGDRERGKGRGTEKERE